MALVRTLLTVLTVLLLLTASILLFVSSFSTSYIPTLSLFLIRASLSSSGSIIPFLNSLSQEISIRFGLWGVCFRGSGFVDVERRCGTYQDAAENSVVRRISSLSNALQKIGDIAIPALKSVNLIAASFLALLFLLTLLLLLRPTTRSHLLFLIPFTLLALLTLLLLIAIIVAISIFYTKARDAFVDSGAPGTFSKGTAFTVVAVGVGIGLAGILEAIVVAWWGCGGERRNRRERRGGKKEEEMRQTS